jgi:hypothetical protein
VKKKELLKQATKRERKGTVTNSAHYNTIAALTYNIRIMVEMVDVHIAALIYKCIHIIYSYLLVKRIYIFPTVKSSLSCDSREFIITRDIWRT